MKLSFRNRIAVFTASAAAATIGLVFLLVYGVVYRTAYSHLDDDILLEKEEVMNNLHWNRDSILLYSMPEWEEKEHKQVEVNPTFLQVVDAKGHVLFRTGNLQNDLLLFDPELTQSAFYNGRISDQQIRQGQFPIQNEQGVIIGHLTVGISQKESALVLHNLSTTLWIAFPFLLLVLFLASAFAASKGIAPVQQLIRAAADISGKNIQARLPLPENEDEIHKLATTINALLDRIERSMRREKQFTADASHEIRTPLTGIRGTLEVLMRKPRTSEQYEEKIRRVIREVDRLSGMLDQLLQLARLESGGISIQTETVDLKEIFRSLADRWKGPLEAKNMQLHCSALDPALPTADVHLLTIILDNLVGNAIKYGHEGGRVDCLWHPESNALSVRDDGPGIPKDQVPFLFDRFYRGEVSRNTKVPGAGLGLSISKKLADLLGIHLDVSSEEGKGTIFMLEFP